MKHQNCWSPDKLDQFWVIHGLDLVRCGTARFVWSAVTTSTSRPKGNAFAIARKGTMQKVGHFRSLHAGHPSSRDMTGGWTTWAGYSGPMGGQCVMCDPACTACNSKLVSWLQKGWRWMRYSQIHWMCMELPLRPAMACGSGGPQSVDNQMSCSVPSCHKRCMVVMLKSGEANQ